MSGRTGNLVGQIAIVTGAGQGIGRSYAVGLAQAGAKVCVCDIALPQETAEAVRAAGGQVLAVAADVTNDRDLEAMVSKTLAELGAPNILVNNAALFGRLTAKSLLDIDTDEWDRVMSVNVRGTWQAIKACVPHMRAGGSIINISSGTVFKGSPYLLHYVASKGAIIALTRATAKELGPKNIRVNAVAPGVVLSENLKSNPSFKELAETASTSRSLQRDSLPEDIIGAVLFLASPDSAFITGQTIVVDGGAVMH